METRASKVILHEPIITWFQTRGLLRLLRIKRMPIPIYPSHPGTMVKISGILPQLIGVESDLIDQNPIFESFKIVAANAKPTSKMVAVAILNSWWTIPLFSGILSKWLYLRSTSEELEALATIAVVQANIKGFMSTTVFLRGLNVLSPKTKETGRNTTEEIIASGASSGTA